MSDDKIIFVGIVGSREYPLPDLVRRTVEKIYEKYGDNAVIVSGGARGVDTIAVDTAKRLFMPYLIFPANWDKYGKPAGPRRNSQIVAVADYIVAFWDGQSSGTNNTVEKARKKGTLRAIYGPDGGRLS